MELKQIRIFLAVADELHFGRAAVKMHMTQPALSAQVRTLEEQLGVRLFFRTTRTVNLTRAGEAFLPEARAAVAQAEAAMAAARAAGIGGNDVLKLGGVDSATAGLLPRVIRAFRSKVPDVHLKVTEILSIPALQCLTQRSLDLAFVRFPPKEDYLCSRHVFREPMVVALPIAHPCASQEVIEPIQIADEPLVISARSHRPLLFDIIQGYLRGHGVEPLVRQEATERHMITAMVAAGLGVSLVPRWVSEFRRDDVVFLPLTDGGPNVDVHVAWRANENMAAAHRFLEMLPSADD